jgi:hypothetical protein
MSRHRNPSAVTTTVWRSPWYSRTIFVHGFKRRDLWASGLLIAPNAEKEGKKLLPDLKLPIGECPLLMLWAGVWI